MYTTLLLVHSWLRWVVLLAAVIALVDVYRGWLGRRPWAPSSRGTSMLFISSLDLQVLAGLALYFTSPLVKAAMSDFGMAMKDKALRFFAVEHITLMLFAVAAAHIGNARARRAPDDTTRYRKLAVWFTIAVLLILVAIPWPGRAIGRELFRF